MITPLAATAPPPTSHDATLAQRAVTDRDAFATLYRSYLPIVYRYLVARLGNVQEAEDLAAQSFEAAMKSIARYDGRSSLATWLIGIARHKVQDYLRHHRPTVPLDEAHIVSDRVAERALQRAEVAEVLRRLPADYAEVLALRFYAGLSVAECAQTMGRSDGSIKMLTLRAIEAAQCLAAREEER